MKKDFSYKEAIKFGWETAKKNWKFFVLLLVIYLLLNVGPRVSGRSFVENPSLGIVLALVGLIIGFLKLIMDMGFIRISLNLVDGKKIQFSDIYSESDLFLKYFLGTILYYLIIFGGLILLIVPGIIFALKFQYYGYLIIDKKLAPVEALKMSSKLTQGVKLKLLVFGFLLGLIDFVGALVFLIGLFLTIPTSMVAQAFVFRKLEKHS